VLVVVVANVCCYAPPPTILPQASEAAAGPEPEADTVTERLREVEGALRERTEQVKELEAALRKSKEEVSVRRDVCVCLCVSCIL